MKALTEWGGFAQGVERTDACGVRDPENVPVLNRESVIRSLDSSLEPIHIRLRNWVACIHEDVFCAGGYNTRSLRAIPSERSLLVIPSSAVCERNVQSRSLSSIDGSDVHYKRLPWSSRSRESEPLYAYPCPLIRHKIDADLSPFKIRHSSISDSGNDPEPLQNLHPFHRFPPWRGCILGFFAICGIFWGWRNDRALPWSLYAFIVGILLWAWALLILLPWSVSC